MTMTDKQRAAHKRYEKRHNYFTKTLAHRTHSHGSDNKHNNAPAFIRKEEHRQLIKTLMRLFYKRNKPAEKEV